MKIKEGLLSALAMNLAVAVCFGVLFALSACQSTVITTPFPNFVPVKPATIMVTNGHVVNEENNPAVFVVLTNHLPFPSGIVSQDIVVTNRVAGTGGQPLVAGHANPRTNITLTLTAAMPKNTVGVHSNSGSFYMYDTGFWLQATTNLTSEQFWTNLLWIPANGSNDTVNVKLSGAIYGKWFRFGPDVWVETNN